MSLRRQVLLQIGKRNLRFNGFIQETCQHVHGEISHETMKPQVSISNLNLSSLGHLLNIFYVKLIYFCLVLTPQWSEWGACTKNRTRPDISCLASYSTDSCPTEVEREGCSSSGNSCSFEVISVKLICGMLGGQK